MRVVRKASRVSKKLEEIAPEVDADFLALVAVDITDTWEIAERHRERVVELLRLKGGARGRKRLSDMLHELLYRDVMAHFDYHAKSMKKNLPKLIDTLEKKSR